MAAFAADRFVLRGDAEDGWTRVIALEVAVSEPERWTPQLRTLEAAFRFLTGDIWHLTARGGGATPPTVPTRPSDRDAICLFSGGLDSLLGALKLLADGRRPFLVSQGSPKELGPQLELALAIGLEEHRFEGRIAERWRAPYEGSTRGRSLIFFAYGVVAASAHDLDEVIIPENGLIAINPPFTPRRMGSLSTRTTHPHFLAQLESALAGAGLNIRLTNIFEGHTKGEMMAACSHQALADLAARSYSCGKGKRLNAQCGRCVPCLIRRAAFRKAGINDGTPYGSRRPNGAVRSALAYSSKNDDVMAARHAAARARAATEAELRRWATKSGPLPSDPDRREKITGAVARGLVEVSDFLDGVAWR
jgi:7-cyano-7-deazaguanine synthase in queuosine biosynthesis